MPRLIDETIEALTEVYAYFVDLDYFGTYTILPLLKRYEDIKRQETEEAKLTEDDLIDEPSDFTALSLEYEENVVIDRDLLPHLTINGRPIDEIFSSVLGNINAQEE